MKFRNHFAKYDLFIFLHLGEIISKIQNITFLFDVFNTKLIHQLVKIGNKLIGVALIELIPDFNRQTDVA